MFGKKKAAIIGEQMGTVIGKDTLIKGVINSKGSIRVDGQIEGELTSAGDMVIGESAVVNAQIKARNATIAGQVNGNVEVSEKLELLPSANLVGDMKVGMLIIGEGAKFKGICNMQEDKIKEIKK